MKTTFNVRHVAIAAVLAGVAATAWAANEGQAPELIVIAQYSGAPNDPITVEERRLTADGRIQADVISRLRAMDNIQGLIGVEANGGAVRLTGLVTTTGQAYRAGREALNASGVQNVENSVRSRLGATH